MDLLTVEDYATLRTLARRSEIRAMLRTTRFPGCEATYTQHMAVCRKAVYDALIHLAY